ncbi:MAG: secondary thiamine-phosphate synthase enzyme YjbQ [Desulfuromonadaceae bacterium]|nr:secondary thiamine-phosphate synthase enzyme YjbQ [Desulfuromonadaceae bacterium]MDD2847043.1 secondary thiamine-phosphate synthase enzyme YjbQ [Desulfuromonadaceae bacterium]MDD4128979.1 secondary thiamine-phosphate synthase enzyme YjbQ [Desulfuromonadaceae bacterium]
MKTAELHVSTARRTQFVSITSKIAEVMAQNGWQDGVLTVFVPHTTAGVTINENADPDVARDMEMFSDELVPQSHRFRHSEGNSDAHIKAGFYGSSVQVIIRHGNMWLGTWQGIYFCEFDGPRERSIRLAFCE